MKLMRPHHLQNINKLNHQSNHEHQQNSRADLQNLYPQTCLKMEVGRDGFKQTSRNLETLVKFQEQKNNLPDKLCQRVIATELKKSQ